MSEEKLFDVNWDQRKWETPASAQDMKLYSYPPRTIRNMSVPGFLTWLVLLLASIGGLLYTASLIMEDSMRFNIPNGKVRRLRQEYIAYAREHERVL